MCASSAVRCWSGLAVLCQVAAASRIGAQQQTDLRHRLATTRLSQRPHRRTRLPLARNIHLLYSINHSRYRLHPASAAAAACSQAYPGSLRVQ